MRDDPSTPVNAKIEYYYRLIFAQLYSTVATSNVRQSH